MKKIVLIFLVIILIIGGGVVFFNSKDSYDKTQYFLKRKAEQLEFKLPDQFNKAHVLSSDTKILILAFKKEDGHTVRKFLRKNKPNFLAEHKAYFIADISKVPVVIRNLFILKDLKKSKFPVLLIYDKEISDKLNENKRGIVIMYLQNKKIIKSKTIHDEKDLRKIFG